MGQNQILISTFGAFLNVRVNPTRELGQELSQLQSCSLIELPVQFGESYRLLKSEILKSKPQIVIMLGVAGDRNHVCLETIGLNWVQSRGPDAAGLLPQTGAIVPGLELAFMTQMDVGNILSQLPEDSRKYVRQSFSAGTYVCNDLYFRTLCDLELNCQKIFIHVPPFEVLEKSIQVKILKELVNCIRGN